MTRSTRILRWSIVAAVGLAPRPSFAAEPVDYQTAGVVENLPVFAPRVIERLRYPLAWTTGTYSDFADWRRLARERVLACLLTPPPGAPWNARVIDTQDRGAYVARKLVFNVSGDSRVLACLTVPKGKGPFPAVLLLHDHGAKFDIGKEKLIRPWGIAPGKIASAEAWVGQNYGGRYLGDFLAQRGYVCFSTDALNWSDRGGGGYAGQPQLASNLMHLGMSFAGLMAWEDLRAAEFFAQQPEVDPRRIAATGLSMGAYRTWQIAALSENIAAGVAICWMAEAAALMTPGNNQTRTVSTFSMLHPGLLTQLDYPDVASIACPKPMLFFNGRQDRLFPVDSVERAYARMHAVWKSQGADERLVTRLWDGPHQFNAEMQDVAFAWLDRVMREIAARSGEGRPAKR